MADTGGPCGSRWSTSTTGHRTSAAWRPSSGISRRASSSARVPTCTRWSPTRAATASRTRSPAFASPGFHASSRSRAPHRAVDDRRAEGRVARRGARRRHQPARAVPVGRAVLAAGAPRRPDRAELPLRHRAPEAAARRLQALPRARARQRRPHHHLEPQPARQLRVPLGACREGPHRRLRPARRRHRQPAGRGPPESGRHPRRTPRAPDRAVRGPPRLLQGRRRARSRDGQRRCRPRHDRARPARVRAARDRRRQRCRRPHQLPRADGRRRPARLLPRRRRVLPAERGEQRGIRPRADRGTRCGHPRHLDEPAHERALRQPRRRHGADRGRRRRARARLRPSTACSPTTSCASAWASRPRSARSRSSRFRASSTRCSPSTTRPEPSTPRSRGGRRCHAPGS